MGLRCCTWAFSSWVEQGLLFIVVTRLLTAVASFVVELRLHVGFRTHSVWAQLWLMGLVTVQHVGLWDLPGPGLEPASLALPGAFSSTGPPGEPTKGFDRG